MTEHGTFSIRESFGGVRPLVEVMDEFAAAGLDAVVDREGMGALFLRADDCERLLTTRGFAAVAMPVLEMSGVSDGPLHELWSVLMFGKDGAEHRRIRGAVARSYTAGAVAGQERFVGDLAGRLAGALPSGAAFDLYDDYALPLASRSVCRLVGLPAEDVGRATAWSLDLVAAFGALSVEARSRAETAAGQFCSYLDDLLRQPERLPDGIAARLVADPDLPLSYAELRGLIANLTFGGLDAIAKSLTTGVYHLLVHGRWDELVAEPELAPLAAEELLRFFPPTGATIRVATEAFSCGGVDVDPRQLVLPSLRAACRDPEAFANPDAIDLRRPPGKPYAFGAGAHFCLGLHLARLVLGQGLAALARRAPSLALAVSEARIPWGARSTAWSV